MNENSPPPDPFDLSTWETYGFVPLISSSIDRNFMDITLLVTRTSICKQGFMGCVITNDTTTGEVMAMSEEVKVSFNGGILGFRLVQRAC